MTLADLITATVFVAVIGGGIIGHVVIEYRLQKHRRDVARLAWKQAWES